MMSKWFNFVSKTNGNIFINHSGLTNDSKLSSLNFIQFLSRFETVNELTPLLKERKLYGPDAKKIFNGEVRIFAKTGKMQFNRGLAGYIIKNGVPRAGFAIFSADIEKKNFFQKNNLFSSRGSKRCMR